MSNQGAPLCYITTCKDSGSIYFSYFIVFSPTRDKPKTTRLHTARCSHSGISRIRPITNTPPCCSLRGGKRAALIHSHWLILPPLSFLADSVHAVLPLDTVPSHHGYPARFILTVASVGWGPGRVRGGWRVEWQLAGCEVAREFASRPFFF